MVDTCRTYASSPRSLLDPFNTASADCCAQFWYPTFKVLTTRLKRQGNTKRKTTWRLSLRKAEERGMLATEPLLHQQGAFAMLQFARHLARHLSDVVSAAAPRILDALSIPKRLQSSPNRKRTKHQYLPFKRAGWHKHVPQGTGRNSVFKKI